MLLIWSLLSCLNCLISLLNSWYSLYSLDWRICLAVSVCTILDFSFSFIRSFKDCFRGFSEERVSDVRFHSGMFSYIWSKLRGYKKYGKYLNREILKLFKNREIWKIRKQLINVEIFVKSSWITSLSYSSVRFSSSCCFLILALILCSSNLS
jgi:hypothetical protein